MATKVKLKVTNVLPNGITVANNAQDVHGFVFKDKTGKTLTDAQAKKAKDTVKVREQIADRVTIQIVPARGTKPKYKVGDELEVSF